MRPVTSSGLPGKRAILVRGMFAQLSVGSEEQHYSMSD